MFDTVTADREAAAPLQIGRAVSELLAVAADPADGPAMAAWLREHARLQAQLDGHAASIRRAFDASLEWARDGVRSPATWLTHNTGCSTYVARTELKTADLAHSMAHVRAASLAGDLSAEKVRWLTRARKPEVAEAFDEDEAELVELARGLNVDRLREALHGWYLGALERLGRNAPDGEPPLPETIADRLSLLKVAFGRAVVEGELSPQSHALLLGALDAELRHWRRTGQLDAEDTRTLGELYAAALLEIVERGSQRGTEHGAPRPLLIATLDLSALDLLHRRYGPGSGGAPGGDPDDPGPDGPVEPDPDDPYAGEPDPGEPEPEPDVPGHASPEGPERSSTDPGHDETPPKTDGQAGSDAAPDVDRRSGCPDAAHPAEPDLRATRADKARPTTPTCRIAGVGPVPLAAIARLLHRGADVCRVVLAGDGTVLDSSRTLRAGDAAGLVEAVARAPSAPLDLGRTSRLGSAAHYRALVARTGGTCDTPGCNAPPWRAQIHHLHPWEDGGGTDVDNLALLCRFHHDRLHHGFTLRTSPSGLRLHRPDGAPVAVGHR